MKAYEVNPGYQRHLVICDTIAEAEKIFNARYGIQAAREIKLIAEYVEVKGIDYKDK
jgi:hypothetical protein